MRLLSLPQRIVAMSFARYAQFFIPVSILYYQQKDISLGDIFMLVAAYRLLLMVLEVPAGFLADRWQRHRQLVFSDVLWVFAAIAIMVAHGPYQLFAAFALAAFCDALHSGTGEAYMREALRAEGREHEDTKWQGRLFAASLLAEVVTGFAGGWLYEQWVEFPALLTVVFALVGLALSLTFPFVPRVGAPRHDNPWQDLRAVMRWSLHEHPRLPWLIAAPRLLFALTGTLYWALQTRLVELQISATWLGISFGAYFLAKTVASLVVDKVHMHAGEARMLLGLIVILVLGVVLMTAFQSPLIVWIGGVLGAGIVHALGQPLATSLINREVSDYERATVLSTASLVSGLYGGALMLAIGPMLKHWSFSTVVVMLLVITLVLAIYPFYRLLRPRV